MATYSIHYTFTRCTDNGSSDTYTNDFETWSMLKAKAVDGCYFVEHDSTNNFGLGNNGTFNVPFDLTKVASSDNQKVIDGEMNGITSDGKYICRRIKLSGGVKGDFNVTFNATGGEPLPTPSITNNVAHTTHKTETQGNDTVITLKCADGFVFDGTPTVTYGTDPDDPFSEGTTANMVVSGNVATFTLATSSYGGFAVLNGKTKETTPKPQNNITYTTYKTETDPFDDSTTVTITCDDGFVFDGAPTVKYVNTSGAQTVVTTTLNDTATVATAIIEDLKNIVSLDGKTKAKPVEPVEPTVTNNITYTTYKTETDPFEDSTTVTITCDGGFVFDGAPTVKYVNTSGAQTVVTTTLNDTATVATAIIEDLKNIVSLDGKTKAKHVEPVEPTVTNNIQDATETHSVDGDTVTVNLSSKKVMLNASCAYVGKDGSNKNVPVTINVVVNPDVDVDSVTSNGSVVLPDVDFNHPIVITGTTKQAIPVIYSLSGCTPVEKPDYCFVGEVLTMTLTADDENEFADASKCTITGYSNITDIRVFNMTISQDKLTATGSITPTVGTSGADDVYILVAGVASPTSTPTKKYGFINAYVLNEKNLDDFATARFVAYTGNYPSTKEDPISYDLGDYVNRVKRFFFPVKKGSTSKLMCGTFQVDTDVYNLADDTKVVSFGSVDIPNITESTADYDTELNMFVPFIGLVSLPVDIIGCTVTLEMRVNLLGGGGVYLLTCDDRIVWADEVQPNTDVLFRTQKQEVRTVGGSKFDSTYLMGLTPYIILQKKTITSAGVETSASRLTKVKDISGFTKLVNVKFADTSNMLMEDVNNITTILRNGFTL